ncbi:type IV pilus modification PilV family protein [Pseudalkalibacillus sp. Hm43]|uniref:type IV pilus modification PilV family protein n=1 Tax=Pseudalkalibacillus sp. Hm43 TaxID=3450742 RepID=UPI003F42CB42
MNLNQEGLSLIEVLATLVIIGIVFTLLFQSTDFLSTATSLHDHKKEAAQIAEQVLKEALEQQKEGIPQRIPENIEGYSIDISVTKLAEPSNPRTPQRHVSLSGVFSDEQTPKILTVTVSWGE